MPAAVPQCGSVLTVLLPCPARSNLQATTRATCDANAKALPPLRQRTARARTSIPDLLAAPLMSFEERPSATVRHGACHARAPGTTVAVVHARRCCCLCFGFMLQAHLQARLRAHAVLLVLLSLQRTQVRDVRRIVAALVALLCDCACCG